MKPATIHSADENARLLEQEVVVLNSEPGTRVALDPMFAYGIALRAAVELMRLCTKHTEKKYQR